MDIGKSIEIALIHRGIKKKDLADQLEVSRTYVSYLVGSETCSPSMLDKLSRVFEMKASEFIALGEE